MARHAARQVQEPAQQRLLDARRAKCLPSSRHSRTRGSTPLSAPAQHRQLPHGAGVLALGLPGALGQRADRRCQLAAQVRADRVADALAVQPAQQRDFSVRIEPVNNGRKVDRTDRERDGPVATTCPKG